MATDLTKQMLKTIREGVEKTRKQTVKPLVVEDKETIAIPLFNALKKLGLSTFLDADSIRLGDSIHEVINKALGNAEVFVAVISNSSKEKPWPKKEINAAISRKIAGKQIFVPIFVGLDEEIEDLQTRFSLISDLLYEKWKDNPDEIAQKIQKIL